MLKSIQLARLLVRLARASKPRYYEVGPSYQELDIANGEGSARIVKYGKRRFILFSPYGPRSAMLLPLNKALELRDAKSYREVQEIPGYEVGSINGPRYKEN